MEERMIKQALQCNPSKSEGVVVASKEQSRSFLVRFAPKDVALEVIASFDERENPTFARIVEVYGLDVFKDLIKVRLSLIFTMMGTRFASENDLLIVENYTAEILAEDEPHLRIRAFDYFCKLFTKGELGENYSSGYNSQKFFEALKRFKNEKMNGRGGLYDRIANK